MWTTVCLSLALLAVPGPKVEQDAAPPSGPTLSVSGIVQDDHGKPLAAVVVLRPKAGGTGYIIGLDHNREVLAKQDTSEDGRFQLDRIAIPLRFRDMVFRKPEERYGGVELLVWAEGKVLKWIDINPNQPTSDLRITLQPAAQVSGVIRSKAGQALEGATVRLTTATLSTQSLDPFYRSPGDLNLLSSQVNISARSDAQGRFQLPHMPVGYRVGIAVAHPGFHRLFTMVNTSPDVEVDELRPEGRVHKAQQVHRSPVELQLDPAKLITFIVTTSDGKPVTRGGMHLVDSERHYAGQGASDAEGRISIPIRKNGTFKAYYVADPLQPTMNDHAEVTVTDGEEPKPIELRLPAAEQLEGRVVDGDSGDAVPGVLVRFVQIKGEGSAADLGASSYAVSRQDGTFRIPVVAGKGSLRIHEPVSGYQMRDFSMPIEVSAGEPIKPVTLRLSRGLLVRGRVLDADGKGVSGAMVRGQEQAPYFATANAVSGDDGSYELGGLPVAGPIHIFATHERGAANATVEPKKDAASGQTVVVALDLKLQAGVALQGRVLQNGKPRADLAVQLRRSFGDQGNRFNSTTATKTDAEGRYRFTGLEPGDNYTIEIRDGEDRPSPEWTHQSPYVKTVSEGPLMEIDDVNLMRFGQTLAGVVVSPQGEPVADVTVSAQTSSGNSISRPVQGPPPWTETDSMGRFRLTELPDEDLQLMAWRRNPQGGVIRFPAKVKCERNQTNVRIILDPRLVTEVEDLDAPKKDE